MTQRGRAGRAVFATDEERRAWLGRMFELARECGVRVWGYCLMPDHVHVVAAPDTEAGLSQLMRRLQADYARAVNFFRREHGGLWEGRYAACAMTEADALMAVAHIERNPVRAGLCNTGGRARGRICWGRIPRGGWRWRRGRGISRRSRGWRR